jgi:hypothetical protein
LGDLSSKSNAKLFWTIDAIYVGLPSTVENRWDEKAGLRRDAVRSQVINVLEAQAIKETGNEED